MIDKDFVRAAVNDQDAGPSAQEERARVAEEARRQALEIELDRLAALTPSAYESQRKAAAKKLDWRPSYLDAEVEKRRHRTGAQPAEGASAAKPTIELPHIEPWPEAVETGPLLDAVRAFVQRFVVLGFHQINALVLWICFTHVFEIAEVSPRLAIQSPAKRCGKSTCERLLKLFCPRPLMASNISPAAIFRAIDSVHPTLLLDEVDSFTTKGKQKSERAEECRGILNSGHTPDAAFVIRNTKVGDDWVPKQFSTWSPIVYAAIGRLPDTWQDRSIQILMKRRLRTEKVEKMTRRNLKKVQQEAAEIAAKLARWGRDSLEVLRDAEPDMPDGLNDRAEDNWDLLIAIADMAGAWWAKSARNSALALSGDNERDADDSFDLKLLADIREVIDGAEYSNIGSTELCRHLAALEGSLWASMRPNGKPITTTRLASMLKPFEIYPKKNAARNEYVLADLREAFERYIPIPKPSDAHSPSNPPQSDGAEEQPADRPVSSDGGSSSSVHPTGSGRNGGLETQNGHLGNGADFKVLEDNEIDRLAAADADDLFVDENLDGQGRLL